MDGEAVARQAYSAYAAAAPSMPPTSSETRRSVRPRRFNRAKFAHTLQQHKKVTIQRHVAGMGVRYRSQKHVWSVAVKRQCTSVVVAWYRRALGW